MANTRSSRARQEQWQQAAEQHGAVLAHAVEVAAARAGERLKSDAQAVLQHDAMIDQQRLEAARLLRRLQRLGDRVEAAVRQQGQQVAHARSDIQHDAENIDRQLRVLEQTLAIVKKRHAGVH